MRSRLAALRFFVIWYWRTLNERAHVAANSTRFKKKRSQCACTTLTPTATRTLEPSSSVSAQENHQIFFPKKKTYRQLATQELKSLPKHETMSELAFARRFTISTLPLCHIGALLPTILARITTTRPSRVKSKYTFNAHFCTKRKVIRF